VESFAGVMALLFFAMFVASGFVILTISYATQVYSSAHAGLLAGLGAGAWGAAVAVVMPWFGRMFDREMYAESFLAAALCPVAAYAIWCFLNRDGMVESGKV
jgi:hypothetical protein